MSDLRVLVVADDSLSRAGLAALLADQPGCNVIGQVAGDADFTTAQEVYRPDVLVWDLGWKPSTAMERLAGRPDDGLPVLALLPDDSHAAAAWTSGVRGLLLRDAGATSLVAALKAVGEGLVVLGLELAATLPAPRGPASSPMSTELTTRELEVLRLVAEGLPNKAIAHRLGISEHTIKFHVNSIMGKFGAQSRTEAVISATRQGLILL